MKQVIPVSRATFDEVMVPTYQPADVLVTRGLGSHIWDQQGRNYIDFAGGVAVTSLGHCFPKLVAALEAQAHRIWHVSNVMTNEPALQLAYKLVDTTFASRVFFCNSGAEANEAAFKLARRYGVGSDPDKCLIVAFGNAFHGRTLFTVSVGGQPQYADGFGPLPEGILHLPFNDVSALEKAMSRHVCAIVMELVQGEGGVNVADPLFVQAARDLCNHYDALLILDEVQTGMGRTGHLFAHEYYGIVPDVLTTAKGLGGGFPIGAMLCNDRSARAFTPGSHGSTYGGNPLACAVASVVLDEVNSSELLEGVRSRSELMGNRLDTIGKRYGIFDHVRGLGLLLGVPLSENWKGRVREIVDASLRNGVWALAAGPDVLRFAPALNIPVADVNEGLDRLDRACAELVKGDAPFRR